jgi:hypothetical protein
MAGLRRSPALFALLLCAAAAPAQGVVVNGSFTSRGGFGRSGSLTLSGGSVYGPAYNYGYGRYYSSGRAHVTVIYSGAQIVMTPIVLEPPSSAGPDDDAPARRTPDRRDQPPAPPPPVPGQNAGVFRPLEPDNRERARRPFVVEPMPPPELPAPATVAEGASLVERARAAFAAGEFGRAADCFRRAAEADPADPMPPFLLVQTLIALGKYTAAADVARAAVERFPGWPALPYRSADLYGASAADLAADLLRLDETRGAHPDDPVLLFLAGYVRWYADRKDEARALFRRAAPAFPAAERFLRVPPAVS